MVSPLPWSKWRTLELDLIRFYDGHVRAGSTLKKIPNSPSASCRAWLLRKGKGCIGTPKTTLPLQPGHWIFPSQETCWQEFSKDAQILSIHYRATWPDGSYLFDMGQGVMVEAVHFPQLEAEALKIKEVIDAEMAGTDWFLSGETLPLDTFLHVDGALRSWLWTLTQVAASFKIYPSKTVQWDERVEKGLQWLNNRPINEKFLEEQLAKHLGISVVHLNRLFNKELGMSPVDILDRRRLERAIDLLQFSKTPIKRVAYDLGFCSPSYFTAWFRLRTGKAPRGFRQT